MLQPLRALAGTTGGFCSPVALEREATERHSATNVGKSRSVLAASADDTDAAHACSLAYWVGMVATRVHACDPSAQPRIAITK